MIKFDASFRTKGRTQYVEFVMKQVACFVEHWRQMASIPTCSNTNVVRS
jgi:hypothetical protein